uniref:ribosomal protein L29 n=1 Tax=Stephanopyxis turris TaxID=515487 RepID=UPI0022F2FEBB|nr:ribosomal protein L29 [Stephanopyxis turris]WAJ57655.1 ribosomal protein L29 [Stephanopyxis turris]
MALPKFSDVTSFSDTQISEEILKTEKELFNLRFKKATRQPFKAHEIKNTKRRIAHLKTFLTSKTKKDS